jgi:hypothetical protein
MCLWHVYGGAKGSNPEHLRASRWPSVSDLPQKVDESMEVVGPSRLEGAKSEAGLEGPLCPRATDVCVPIEGPLRVEITGSIDRILKFPSPGLHMPTDRVKNFDSALQMLADLFDTMQAERGVGITVPHVGVPNN